MTDQISTVNFHGQSLQVIQQNDQLYVPIKPICENIGIQWRAQRKRILRDEVLNSVVSMMDTTASDGKSYEFTCLPLQYLNGWLFGVDPSRIKNEPVRQRVLQYQRECYQVLSDYWLQGSATRKPRHLQFEPSYDFTPLNLSGSRTVTDAQKLMAEIKKHMTPATQPLVRELEDTLVSIWTNTDEAMHRMTVAQNMMKRVRGHHPV